MVTVCAWCERFLGLKSGEQVTVSHGICGACSARMSWEDDPPTLVVSRQREQLLPVMEQVVRGLPEIRVVLERRDAERRSQPRSHTPERRGSERRRGHELRLI